MWGVLGDTYTIQMMSIEQFAQVLEEGGDINRSDSRRGRRDGTPGVDRAVGDGCRRQAGGVRVRRAVAALGDPPPCRSRGDSFWSMGQSCCLRFNLSSRKPP